MRSLAAALLALSIAFPAGAATAPKPSTPARSAPRGPSFPLARSTPEEVRAALGEPAVASEEGKGAFWTYRLPDCALMVFFRDEGAGLKVSGVGTGPRRRAETPPDAASCIATAKR